MSHPVGVRFLCLAALSTLCIPEVFSQSIKVDVSATQAAVDYPVSLYQQATKTESHLFNGPEYVDYRKLHREGHQFFMQDLKINGQVHYDGALYTDVPMLYDLVKEELVIVTNGFLLQKLITEKVASFTMNNHMFVRHVSKDSLTNTSLPTAFYDVLYDGNTQMLVNRKKLREFVIKDLLEVERYTSDNKFYIKKDTTYHQGHSGKSVYKVFSDKKKELKKFARTKGFKFRKQREEAILALVQQYDSLSR